MLLQEILKGRERVNDISRRATVGEEWKKWSGLTAKD